MFLPVDQYLCLSERRLTADQGEIGRMEIVVEVQGKEAGAAVVQRSSSPILFLNRDLQRWWWKREVGVQLDKHSLSNFLITICIIVSWICLSQVDMKMREMLRARDPHLSSILKKKSERPKRRPKRSCAVWREIMWVPQLSLISIKWLNFAFPMFLTLLFHSLSS